MLLRFRQTESLKTTIGVSPVPVQMCTGVGPVPVQMWTGGKPSPGADVAGCLSGRQPRLQLRVCYTAASNSRAHLLKDDLEQHGVNC